MAKTVLTQSYIALNGSDLSSSMTKAELTIDVEAKEVTSFGSSGYKENLGGLKTGTLNLEFTNDYAAGALDSVMFPLLGTVVTFEWRAFQTAVSTSNPKYTGSVLITGWNAGGSVGDAAMVTVSFPTQGAVTRATA